MPRADICLKHQRHPVTVLTHRLGRSLNHRHTLIPLTLNRGEHRISLMGQTGRTDNINSLSNSIVNRTAGIATTNGGYRKSK